MAQIFDFTIHDDKVLAGYLSELRMQSMFECIQKAGEDISRHLLTCFLIMTSLLPSVEYIWNLLQRVAIFIPYIIYSQYKYYKLTNRIYQLTWILNYQSQKMMFHQVISQPSDVVPTQVSKTRTSSTSRKVETGSLSFGEICRGTLSSSCVSASGRSNGWDTMEMGDMRRSSNGPGIQKVKSTPTMFRDRRSQLISVFTFNPLELGNANLKVWPAHSNIHQGEIQEMKLITFNASADSSMISEIAHGCIPASKAKKIKRDHRLDTVVMSVFTKPKNPNPPNMVIEFCKGLDKKTPRKSLSELSSTKSTATERFPRRIPSNLMIRNSISKRRQSIAKTNDSATKLNPETECDRKWRNVFEKTEALKQQRIIECATKRSLETERDRKWRNIFEKTEALKRQRINRMREMEIRKMQEKEMIRKIETLKRRAIRAKIKEENLKMKIMIAKPCINNSDDIRPDPVVITNDSPNSNNQTGAGDQLVSWSPPERIPILRVTQRTVRIEHSSKSIDKSKMKYSTMQRVTQPNLNFNVLEASDRIVDQHSEFLLVPTTCGSEPADSDGYFCVEMLPENYETWEPHDAGSEKSNNISSYRSPQEPSDKGSMNHDSFHGQSSGDENESEPVMFGDTPANVRTTQVKSIASEFEKLAAGETNHKMASSTKLHDSEGSNRGSIEKFKAEPALSKMETPEEIEANERPVIKRVKRRLKKGQNESDAARKENSTMVKTSAADDSPRKEIPELSCALDMKGIYLTSLKLKKQEVRKRLEDQFSQQRLKSPIIGDLGIGKSLETEKPSTLKQTRPNSAKNTKTVFPKRNSGPVKFSKSSISLRDFPSQKRLGKKLGRPLMSRVYAWNSPSTSSMIPSDKGTSPNKETPSGTSEPVDYYKSSKIFNHFSDSKSQIGARARKKRFQKKKKLSQLLDSFKSEIKEVITATASSLSRIGEGGQREVENTLSTGDATEDISSHTSIALSLNVLSGVKSSGDRSTRDSDSQRKVISRRVNTEDAKGKDKSPSPNLQAIVNSQPRWNNAAILRARYIKKTRHPESKKSRKGRREVNDSHSLPSSPRHRPPHSKQNDPPESSKSLPPTPR